MKLVSISAIAVCLIGFVGSCKPARHKNIRDYYFPLKQLTTGLVYEYQSVNNDSFPPNYWYYRSFLSDTSIYLTGTYYEQNLEPLQFVREEMVQNGMLLEDIRLYEKDSTGKQQQASVEIIADSVFPFEVRDSGGIFLYHIKWRSIADPEAQMTLVRNRRYAGDTTFIFNGKKYDCVVFELKELIEQDKEGVFEQEFSGLEWYAKGLGLVYYKKNIAKDFVLEYRLAQRYPMEKLEAVFKENLQQ